MNKITELLNIKFPLFQAPMLGVTSPEMVASASNCGCLGMLPLGDLEESVWKDLIQKAKNLTDKPFAVNIFANEIPPIDNELRQKYIKTKNFVEEFCNQNGIKTEIPDIDSLRLKPYHKKLQIIVNEGIKILSFTFGNLDPSCYKFLKSHGVFLIGTCNSLAEAEVLEKSGCDAIIIQGNEAGGHRGTFDAENFLGIKGGELLRIITQKIKIPKIFAGGLANAESILEMKNLGADAFQLGSIFLCSKESLLQDFEKEQLRTNDGEIVLTKSFSGRYASGIKNKFTKKLDGSELILPYPYQNKLTADLRKKARDLQNPDFVNLWRGTGKYEFSDGSTAAILQNLIKEITNFNSEKY